MSVSMYAHDRSGPVPGSIQSHSITMVNLLLECHFYSIISSLITVNSCSLKINQEHFMLVQYYFELCFNSSVKMFEMICTVQTFHSIQPCRNWHYLPLRLSRFWFSRWTPLTSDSLWSSFSSEGFTILCYPRVGDLPRNLQILSTPLSSQIYLTCSDHLDLSKLLDK